jgi:hypothetical protein
MYKFGLIILSVLLAFSFGCGKSGQKNTQQTEQAPAGENGQRRGPGGRGQFNPEEMAKRQTEQIGQFVTFTEGQEAKILEINLKYGEKMRELRRGGPGMEMSDAERQEMWAKREALQTEKDTEIKAVLTEEQVKDYEEYLEDAQRRMQERMQQRPPQN